MQANGLFVSTSMKYSEKLRDPRWQKLRLEVMSRAGFGCENCGDKNSTLHIHHSYYVSKRDPWEYPIGSLSCLCENCHEKITEQKGRVESEEYQGLHLSEWEHGAVFASECKRSGVVVFSETVRVMSESAGLETIEAIWILDKLIYKHAYRGGLINRLVELEKEGVL